MLYELDNNHSGFLRVAHKPVLINEVLNLFSAKPNQRFLDCTFGGGGHSRGILESNENIQLTSLDCDKDRLTQANTLSKLYPNNFKFHNINFSKLDTVTDTDFDGILFDLGVSSFQLDDPDRGFSFKFNSDIDMRLDQSLTVSASDFLENASEQELVEAIRNYGQETRWKHVVRALMASRGQNLLSNTESVAEIISTAVKGKSIRRAKRHPATLSFQGIRIAINKELSVIEEALPKAFEKLASGGKLIVISFHSLEDRMIKRFFRKMAGRPESSKDSRPQDQRVIQAKLSFSKPISASEEELTGNPRSRSARLRMLQKL